MRLVSRIALILLSLALPPAAFAQGVLIADPVVQNVPSTYADSLGGVFNTAFSSATSCRVTAKNEIRDMTKFEALRQQLGSEAMAGLADNLATLLGTDTLVSWSIGRVGETYVVTARALRGSSVFAASSAQSKTPDELIDAAQKIGAELGGKVKCGGRPEIGTLTVEIELEMRERTDNAGVASELTTTAKRRDVITIRGGLQSPIGTAEFTELSKLITIGKEHTTQCAAPGGFKDLPASSRGETTMDANGGGKTEPSIEIEVDGNELHIEGHIAEQLPRTMTQTDVNKGVECGRPYGPDTKTWTTDAVSTAVDAAHFDVRVPFDKTLMDQSGTTSWPIEMNGFKGKGTMTWKLGPRIR